MATGDFNPEIWAKTMLNNWDEKFIWNAVVNRQFERAISGPGDQLHVLNFGDLTVSTYSGTISYEAPPEATDSMSIDLQRYWAFQVGDLQKVQAQPDIVNGYMKRGAIAMNRAFERIELGSLIYGAAGNAWAAKTTSGDMAAVSSSNFYDLLVYVRKEMEDDNTWIDGEMWFTMPPILTQYVQLSSDLIHATETGDQFLRDGKLKKLAGWNLMPVSVSNLTGSGTDGAPYHCLAGNRDAIHFAEQLNKLKRVELEKAFGQGIALLMVAGTKVFQQNADCLCDVTIEVT